MSGKFSSIAEEQIQRAMSEGKFDNLKGAGKPLDFDEYFAAPEDIRVGYTLLKNNDFVPQEVELLREIGELKEKLKSCCDKKEREILTKNLNERSLALTMILERNKRRKR